MKNCAKLIAITLLLNITSLLAGCGLLVDLHNTPKVNPPQYQAKINKIFSFKNNYYLCEVRDWRQPLRGQRTIYLAKVKGYCGRLLKRTPAVNAYLQNSKAWTEWHDDFDLKYRILGMVNPSISYRLDKAVTEYDSVYFDITIMNGAFAGTHAMGAELAS